MSANTVNVIGRLATLSKLIGLPPSHSDSLWVNNLTMEMLARARIIVTPEELVELVEEIKRANVTSEVDVLTVLSDILERRYVDKFPSVNTGELYHRHVRNMVAEHLSSILVFRLPFQLNAYTKEIISLAGYEGSVAPDRIKELLSMFIGRPKMCLSNTDEFNPSKGSDEVYNLNAMQFTPAHYPSNRQPAGSIGTTFDELIAMGNTYAQAIKAFNMTPLNQWPNGVLNTIAEYVLDFSRIHKLGISPHNVACIIARMTIDQFNVPMATGKQVFDYLHTLFPNTQRGVYDTSKVGVKGDLGDVVSCRSLGEAEVVIRANVADAELVEALQSIAIERVVAIKHNDAMYMFERNETLHVLAREYGQSPEGNPLMGAWVLREHNTGTYIDHDRYRADLAERNYITLDRE